MFLAILHSYFLVLEMFLWTKPRGLKIFGQSLEKAQASKVLAANQGLYNGFLAAGLLWGACASTLEPGLFFASCVSVAGLFGGWTVGRKLFFVQGVPGLLTLAVGLALALARPS